jgi:serine/threonine protein kinase
MLVSQPPVDLDLGEENQEGDEYEPVRLYLAPELQNENKTKTHTAAADIWSFGVIVYYILTGGVLPFGLDDLKEHDSESIRAQVTSYGPPNFEDPIWTCYDFTAQDLIKKCLSLPYTSRPTA